MKKKAFYRQFIGSKVSVLVEKAVNEVEGLYKGYSRNYLPVLFPGRPEQVNCEVGVTLEKLEGSQLLGKALDYQ